MGTIDLLNRLADRAQRAEVAAALARHWGVEALFVLVPDHQLGGLRPAPGFRQTLPGGSSWRHFLARCREAGEQRDMVAFPDRTRMVAALAFVAEDGPALVLLGGAPTLSYAEFKALPFALLSGLLRAETAEQAASGLVAAARDTTRRTATLATALDRARAETAAKAGELQKALAEAARLNEQLRRLNETLEERVGERTREVERQTQERLKAEMALLQSQKMEAVGQLTGGVAHDFNNLLSVIVGSLDLMEGMTGGNQRLIRAVDMAKRAADRGASLTGQLLAFARRQMLRPRPIELNEAIGEYENLLRRAVGETVEIRTRFSPLRCDCLIDPVHLETTVLNLAINARDAMPSGGVLSIETALCDQRDREVSDPKRARCVRLMISDTGTGMSPAIVERVFEPFFTTKPAGKGTGLGLSQVYGFVQQSGGRIAIKSAPGKGTAVRIYLPLATGEEAPPDHPGLNQDAIHTGSETILVVEDDSDVTEIVLSMLENAGYRVLTAANALAALSILESNRDVDLLFTDLVMPGGISGAELARTVRELYPNIKLLLTSGYTTAPDVVEEAARDGVLFVLKPYRQRELLTTVRVVLDGRPDLVRCEAAS